MNLYEISHELALIHAELEEAGGELTPDLEAKLDALNLALHDKAENIGRWLLNLHGKEAAIENELERLELMKRRAVNLRSRLKEYLKMGMEQADVKKLEFDAFTLRLQRNPPSCEITDDKAIPAAFQIIRQPDIDKKKILEALKGGEDIPGARLAEPKNHLRIV